MLATPEAQRSALAWIVGKIEAHGLPYQIVGGLAAIAHGGTRPLHDIDLYVPLDHRASAFLQEIRPHITWGPEAVVDGPWDITYLKLVYEEQKIEIGDASEPKIRNASNGEWVTKIIDFDSSTTKTVLGCEVQVMPVEQLIAYKRILGRDVDVQDIRDLSNK